jgi:hypothetical protein
MKQQLIKRPALTLSNPSPFLREQVRENSNHELDWLWAAGQVTATEEIRYCLGRALYINPDNRDTQRSLAKLTARRVAVGDGQRTNGQSLTQPNFDN